MGLKILHLSDLHLGEENQIFKNADEFAGHIVDAIDGKTPDVILVSGDVFNGKQFSNRYYTKWHKEAKLYFEKLIDEINKVSDVKITREDVLFVPGNHEVYKPNAKEDKDVFYRYGKFLDSFYGKRPSFYSKSHYSFFRQYEKQRVIVIGFCSPSYPKGTKEVPYGEIQYGEIREAIQKIREVPQYDEYQIVAVLHHHFYVVEERNKAYVDDSCLRNSEMLLKALQEFNICVFLHGHKHASLNRRININTDITKDDRLVTVLGCGATAKTAGLNTNSINLLEVFKRNHMYDLNYTEYEYRASGFDFIKTVNLPHSRNNREVTSILAEVNEHPDLSDHYRILKERDIYLYEGLYAALDGALCALPDAVARIQNNPDILYYVFAAMHYRSNWRKRDEQNYLKDITDFLSNVLTQNFPRSNQREQVEKMLRTDTIFTLAQDYEAAKKQCDNNKQKELLAFLALGTILTEFYIIVKFEAEEFFSTRIKEKAEYVHKTGEISDGIVGNSIVFSSDEDRRALTIAVKCRNAAAHKTVSLVVKEFELVLIKLEQDFAAYGFKIFYIYPVIEKQKGKTTAQVESYHFAAYIPTLIPLLAGRSIYAHPEAFARELIQNAMDAIATRLETGDSFEPLIKIEFQDENSRLCFRITDNGSGMDKYILERYLTTAGRSFYTSSDYTFNYRPISQFGIGFLSCFMLGKHVTVDTLHCEKDPRTKMRQAYHLDIPNFDGCFFIEEGNKKTVGTTITIYPNPDLAAEGLHFDREMIQRYIEENIVSIPYPMQLSDVKMKAFAGEREIQKRTSLYELCFHIPLIWAGDKLSVVHETLETQYGIYFFRFDDALFKESTQIVLNCGIRIEETIAFNKIDAQFAEYDYYSCCMNLPPNVLTLDVSRDKLSGITNVDWNSIFNALKEKITLYVSREKHRKLPFIIAAGFAPETVNYQDLHAQYDEHGQMILKNKKTAVQNRVKVVVALYQQIVKETGENQLARVADFSKRIVIALDEKWNEVAGERAMDRAMERAMAMAMDMTRAMERAMDMAMDMAMAMARDRAMERAMDRAMERAMDRDMAMAMDRVIARAIVIDKQATMKLRKLMKDTNIESICAYFLIHLTVNIEERTKQKDKVLVSEVIAAIVSALYLFPISSSWLFTPEEAAHGIALDLLKELPNFLKPDKE